MTALTLGRGGRWGRGAEALGLSVLAWAVLVPDTLLWGAVVGAGLTGLAVAAGVLGRPRASLAPARAITADAQPALVRACGACTSAALLRA